MQSSPRQTTAQKFTPQSRKRTIIILSAPTPAARPPWPKRTPVFPPKATATPSRSERIVLSPPTTPASSHPKRTPVFPPKVTPASSRRKRTIILFPPSMRRTPK
jgi:hypothetical protein